MNESILLGAFIIDIIFGDPPMLFHHPIVIIGKLIENIEPFFIKTSNKRVAGFFFVLLILTLTFFFVIALLKIFAIFNNYINFVLCAIFGSFAISLRSLHLETNKVSNALEKNNLNKARKELSFLVSRDTSELEEKDIIRSLIETVSENLTDGVVAPLFYFALLGIPGAFIYKAINTLDSMIGYKNEKYFEFGWFSAKLDDIANFLPARIAAILIVIASFFFGYNWKRSINILFRDRRNTDSPNSGWTEAAVAGALNIQLGGPTPYFGKWHNKPFIGDKIETLEIKHIKKTYKIMYLTAIFFVALIINLT